WEGPLLNLAYRFCRDRAQAADMAQDAFIKIFRALPSFREESTFSTWMISVATNVFRSHARRVVPEITGLEAVTEVADPREALVLQRSTREEVVRRTVQTLPAKYREAVVLFYFHEMNIARASESLGVAQGTLKARLHRARGLLERRLRGLLDPRPEPKEA
ncbi:MAG TPA: RNA polymerase sigma factor, partial [Myxococcaceae bacterium]|nr:RNA polymerase sigma factor [Myxococcaceae bacterium]